jgi:hypothetical protein
MVDGRRARAFSLFPCWFEGDSAQFAAANCAAMIASPYTHSENAVADPMFTAYKEFRS